MQVDGEPRRGLQFNRKSPEQIDFQVLPSDFRPLEFAINAMSQKGGREYGQRPPSFHESHTEAVMAGVRDPNVDRVYPGGQEIRVNSLVEKEWAFVGLVWSRDESREIVPWGIRSSLYLTRKTARTAKELGIDPMDMHHLDLTHKEKQSSR